MAMVSFAKISGQGHDDGPGTAEDPPEILEPEGEPQVEHQQGQDGKDDPDGIH